MVVFLNGVLQKGGYERIKDISFMNTEAGGENADDKRSRLDILAVTNNQERVNIEIPFTNQYDMVKRSIYYWSEVYRPPKKIGMG